jgi:hypothetical protein
MKTVHPSVACLPHRPWPRPSFTKDGAPVSWLRIIVFSEIDGEEWSGGMFQNITDSRMTRCGPRWSRSFTLMWQCFSPHVHVERIEDSPKKTWLMASRSKGLSDKSHARVPATLISQTNSSSPPNLLTVISFYNGREREDTFCEVTR